VDTADQFRPGQAEQIITAQQVYGVGGKPFTPEVPFGKVKSLDQGAHGPVKDDDPPGGDVVKLLPDLSFRYGTGYLTVHSGILPNGTRIVYAANELIRRGAAATPDNRAGREAGCTEPMKRQGRRFIGA
jgi:hypothetical protein